jgi:PAS domain S-box-containing protein
VKQLPFSRWSLRAKLAAFFLVASVVPVAVLAIAEVRDTSRRILDDETELLAARAEHLVAELDAFHLTYQRSISRLVAYDKVKDALRSSADDAPQPTTNLVARLQTHLAIDPAIRGLAVIAPDHRGIATTEPALAGRSLERWRFVRDALAGAPVMPAAFVSEPELGSVASIAYVGTVRDTDDRVLGAVAVWVRAEALRELVKRTSGRAGAGSFAVVLDRDGIRIAHSRNPEMMFHPTGALEPALIEELAAEHRFGPATRELLRDVRPCPEAFSRARAAAFDGGLFATVSASAAEPLSGVGRRIGAAPWTVFYLIPQTAMAAPVGRAAERHIAFAALVGLIALIAGGVFARHIATPIARLTQATQRLARGDRPARIELVGGDEIGELGAAFNTMADELYRTRNGLEALVGQRTSALVDANRTLREREHSLAASEQRYRELYENSPDMYLSADATTHLITDCNQTLCRRLGYDRAELVGRPFNMVYHADHVPSLPAKIEMLQDLRDEITDLERVLRCKDGRRITASLSLRAVRDRAGRISAVRALWRDITSRKQIENDQQFLLGLTDSLRATDPGDVLEPACTRLAHYLGASRCLFAEVDLGNATAIVRRDYHGDQASLSGVLPLTHFGKAPADELSRGLTVVIDDAASDPRTAASYVTAFEPLEVRSFVAVPLLRDGTWVTALVVAATKPRPWHDHEIALVKLVAERVWGWVEHLRVLAELREQSVREAEQDTEARLLRTRQGELARNLREREVLLQEIHHRVKNNLQVISSLINMQVRQLELGSSRDALEQCQTRVLAIALIHEKLYQSKDYSAVHFAEYARSLAASVFHALGVSASHVTLELAIEDIPLGVDRAIPCGLVLNELITNALKHAFPAQGKGTIQVALSRVDGGRIRLRVSDDGPGIPPGFDIQRATSMGLQLVCTLAEQLEAELVVASEGGAVFQLTFAGSEA